MINKFQIIIYLEMILKKSIKEFTKEDFESIKNINIDLKSDLDQDKQLSIEDLTKLLPNLSNITINNAFINNKMINKFEKLNIEALELKNCGIELETTLKDLDKLQELKINNCDMLNFDILKDLNKGLKKLMITNPMDENSIDLDIIKDYIELEELIIEECKIKNTNSLSNLRNLKSLSFLNSDIDDIDNIRVVSDIEKLDEIFIPAKYKNENAVKELNKNIYYNLTHLVYEEKER